MISNCVDRRGPLAVGGAEAVGTGVAAADDDDPLAGGRDRGVDQVALLHPVGARQVLHRLVDAGKLAPGIGRSRRGGAAGEHDRVGGATQFVRIQVDAHLVSVRNRVPSALHLGEAAVEVALLHLELGDAVAQQATDAVGPLVDGDGRDRRG
jgi:hypothetical protein